MVEFRSRDFGDADPWHFSKQCLDWPADDSHPYRWVDIWPPHKICPACFKIETGLKSSD